MGVLDGHEQKQVYVESGLWPLVVALATKLGVPIYKLVNDALREKLSEHFSAAELKALRSLLSIPEKKGRIDVSGRKRRR